MKPEAVESELVTRGPVLALQEAAESVDSVESELVIRPVISGPGGLFVERGNHFLVVIC